MRSFLSLLVLSWLTACSSSSGDGHSHEAPDAGDASSHVHPDDVGGDGVSDATADDGHVHPERDAALDVSSDIMGGDTADAPRSTTRDLTVRYIAPPHTERLSEFVLLGGDGVFLGRAVLRGNIAEEALLLRGVLPDGASRVEWFTDDNDNQRYDAPPTDRAGRMEVPSGPGPHTVTVRPMEPWIDVGAGSTEGTLRGHFSEFDVHHGVTFELSLSPEGEDRTVALYRYRSLSGAGTFDFALHGVLRDGQRYVARWFIDLNDNGVYDPRGDHGAELAFEGRAAGLTLFHQHHKNVAWVE